jgi:lipopolysaccharide export system protein LptA
LGPADAGREKAAQRELVFASENYEFRTNHAVFSGGVQVQERLDNEESGRLTCQTLELELAGTNQLQRMVAERDVKITQGTRQFTGGMLVYDGTQETLLLTEQPEWQDGLRAGKGQQMHFNLKAEEILVSGEAWMRLPAGEFALTAAGTLVQPTNAPAGTNTFAEIFSNEYRLGQTSGEFRGDVRVLHPQMNWTSGVVTLRFPPGGGTAEEIIAVPADFQMTDPKGQIILGQGQKAVYTLSVTANSTNSLLELTGSPATLSMTNGMSVVSRVLLFDVASSKLFAPSGSYKISGQGGSFGDTNAFRFPKMPR